MDKQERWMLRIPNNREGDRFLEKMRKYLNRDTYKVSKMYTGPRPKGTSQVSTRKENATSVRLYVDPKVSLKKEYFVRGVEEFESVLRENVNLKMRLDHVHTELAKAQSLVDWRS